MTSRSKAGVHQFALSRGGRKFELIAQSSMAHPLVVPSVRREDDAFQAWFDTLPRVEEHSIVEPAAS
ncbi:MAG TPA: hypothetical protein VN650_06115 [Gemmatimonadaceae bacterium]|nr:hypothetical protein [Gemmatimonadaceae bacterium]HXS26623.1 hypothetical protein [Steroidobacteraceae bacterium]